MNPITTTSILSLFCLTLPLAAQGSEVTLRTAAKKGASVWLLHESKQEQTIDQGGQQFEIGGSTTHTLHVTVTDVDDKGTLTVETEVVRIHGAMQMGPMGDAEFDSAAPQDKDDDDDGGMGMGMDPKAMTKQMTKLAGKKFTAKVDGRGKATSVEGAEELLKSSGGGPGRMGGQITEATLKQLVEHAFGTMPEKPVAIGASWEQVEKGAGRIAGNNKLTLTLAKCDDATFEITATGTVEKPTEEKEGDEQMNEMLKSMTIQNGKITGSQKVSRQDGFVLEATNVVSMDVEVETPMGSMSMAVKNTMSTKRTTAEAAMPKKAEPAKEAAKTGAK